MIRVVLAENEHLMRTGITRILDAEPDIEVVADVADGVTAVTAVLELQPDVAVLDVRMPTAEDGIAAARQIAGGDTTEAVGRPVGVLMLTSFNVSDAVYEAVRAGATGFVLKDAAPTELGAAVRAVAVGDAWLAPAVTRTVVEDIARRAAPATPAPGRLDKLTEQERHVLRLMAHGLSNDQIAAHLSVVPSTVKTHVNRVFNKLEVGNRAAAVTFAYRNRFVGPDDPPPARTTPGRDD